MPRDLDTFFTVSFSFCQVYLDCSLEQAVLQNLQRSASVKEETIKKMLSHIEKPDPKKFNWERFSVLISTRSSQSDDEWYAFHFLLSVNHQVYFC